MKKISIIVPVYNTSKYLKKCIDSILNQTLKEIELIILNDGSIDDSHSIIKEYDDERIIYVNKNNEGISITRNKGIKLSTGKYITFVDSDDYIDLNFCEKMYTKAEKDNCDIVICDYYNCLNDIHGFVSLPDFEVTSLKNRPNIINEINLGPCNKLYSSKLIKNNEIYFPINTKYEDVPFVCKSLLLSNNIGKINEGLSYFNVREGSQTTTRDETIFDIFKISNQVRDILNDGIPFKIINRLLTSLIINYLLQSRYIKSSGIRRTFINESYKYLNNNIVDWKKNLSFNKFNFLKKIIVKNKILFKLYINLYRIF